MQRRFQFRHATDIVDVAFRLYREDAVAMLLLGALPGTAAALLAGTRGLALPIAWPLATLGCVSLIQLTNARLRGHALSMRTVLNRALVLLPNGVGTSLLVGMTLTVGLLLLVVPGLVLLSGASCALPVVVLEGVPARGALGRSWALTRGRHRKILGAFALLLAISASIGMGAHTLTPERTAGLGNDWPLLVLVGVVPALLMPLWMTVTVLLYEDARYDARAQRNDLEP